MPAIEDDSLLVVRDLKKHFPIKARAVSAARSGRCSAVDGVSLLDRRRRDARPGRRVRLRQVHRRAHGHQAARADRRVDPLRRPRDRRLLPRQHARAPPRHADGLPGPVLVAEPAAHDRHDRRRAVPDPEGQDREGHQGRGAGPAGAGRAQPGALQPLPARVLRRPAAAHRHRPGDRAAAQADRLRRAGLGAGRLDPGAGRQPARGPAERVRPRLHLRRARPVGRPAHRRPGRGHVPRQDHGAGHARHALLGADAPVHARADVRGAGSRPAEGEPARADPARRRPAQPDQPAVRLRVPHPLPALPRGAHRLAEGAVRAGRAGAARGRARAPRPLPLPDRARRRRRRRGHGIATAIEEVTVVDETGEPQESTSAADLEK